MYTVKKLYVYTETLVKVKDTLVKKQDTKKKSNMHSTFVTIITKAYTRHRKTNSSQQLTLGRRFQ